MRGLIFNSLLVFQITSSTHSAGLDRFRYEMEGSVASIASSAAMRGAMAERMLVSGPLRPWCGRARAGKRAGHSRSRPCRAAIPESALDAPSAVCRTTPSRAATSTQPVARRAWGGGHAGQPQQQLQCCSNVGGMGWRRAIRPELSSTSPASAAKRAERSGRALSASTSRRSRPPAPIPPEQPGIVDALSRSVFGEGQAIFSGAGIVSIPEKAKGRGRGPRGSAEVAQLALAGGGGIERRAMG